jgi:hypothetical protein
MDLMTASQQKEARERLMFGGFAACSSQEIDPSSITSCAPPLPDIRCTISGSTYFFELAEVVPPEQAQALATKGVYTYGVPDPDDKGAKAMGAIIRQKQKKTYETGGAPVDLLLYFNKDFPIYLTDITNSEDAPSAIYLAIEECKQHGPFRRIWSYCSWKDIAKLLA